MTVTRPVHAVGTDKQADELIRKAIDLRKSGDDQGAYPLLKEAYERSRSPRAAAQWGFCEQALGRFADAEAHFTEALKAADAWVTKNRSAIEMSLFTVKRYIAYLEVVGEPAGAEVAVDGTVVGRLPLAAPVRVTAGEIEVVLRAPGYGQVRRDVRVEGGHHQKIIMRAERQTGVVPTTSSAVERSSATTEATGASTSPAGVTPVASASAPPLLAAAETNGGASGSSAAESSSSLRRSAKWISWGLATVALGVGTYGMVRNRRLVSDFDRSCANDPDAGPYALPGSTQTDAGCSDLKSDYRVAGTVGVVGLIAGGLLAAGGVVLLLTDPPPADRRDTAAWTCAPGATPGRGFDLSMGCTFRF